jgi:hypothetical protein
MSCKSVAWSTVFLILLLIAGIVLPLLNMRWGIAFILLVPVLLFGFLCYSFVVHKRQIGRLRQSVMPGETFVAEGYVGPNPAILTQTGHHSYRLLVGNELEPGERTSMDVKEIRDKLIGDRVKNIEMWTSSGEADFAPRTGFTVFGQPNYAQSVLDMLLAGGVRRKDQPTYAETVENIRQKVVKQGLNALSHPEQVIYSVDLLENLVADAGFDLFFNTPQAEFPLDPVDALEEIGAVHAAEVVRKAMALIPPGALARKGGIMEWQKAIDSETLNKLEQLDVEFHAESDLLHELGSAYSHKNVGRSRPVRRKR